MSSMSWNMRSMRKKLIPLAVMFAATGITGKTQEYIPSSPMNNHLQLNPALAGIGSASRISFNYKNHFIGQQSIFSTLDAAYKIFSKKYSSGVGIYAMNDRQGNGNFNELSINALYAYRIDLQPQYYLSGGLQASIIQRSFDPDGLILPSMITATGEVRGSPSLAEYNTLIPDFSMGIAAVLLNQQIGFSVHHLTSPYVSADKSSRLPRKYTVFWFKNYELKRRGLLKELIILSPNLQYRYQMQHQVHLGLNTRIQNLTVGVELQQPLQLSLNKMNFMAGYYYQKRYGIFYRYEFYFPRQNYGFSQSGAHEVTFFMNLRYNENNERIQ